MSRNSDSNDNQ